MIEQIPVYDRPGDIPLPEEIWVPVDHEYAVEQNKNFEGETSCVGAFQTLHTNLLNETAEIKKKGWFLKKSIKKLTRTTYNRFGMDIIAHIWRNGFVIVGKKLDSLSGEDVR